MFETFEHTADLGLRIRARSLDELFAEAGRAFSSIVIDNVDALQPREEINVELQGDDREYLLFDWLNELLYRYETSDWLAASFEVAVDERGLRATLRGEPIDPQRHARSHEVKAITYHGLKVAETEDGWLAELIVDI